jgi:hypothetical protein
MVVGVLTPFDDYAIHQTPMPISHPISGDPNQYDRYFFNGYDRAGELFFGAAMGLYPNRRTMDAAFSVVRDGTQHSVLVSGRCPLDRTQTRIGPISLEVIEPLRTNRLCIDAPDQGIVADLVWEARTPAIEEPLQSIHDGPSLVMAYTRLAQWGNWHGTIDLHGERIEIAPEQILGTKDKSWGTRPVGQQVPGPAAAGFGARGGIFWLWAPVNWDDECTHLAVFEHPDGTRWYESASRVPVLAEGDAVWGAESKVGHARVDYDIRWKSGTRRSAHTSLTYHWDDGTTQVLEFEPLLDFQMQGIGYTHPKFGHGYWNGELAVTGETWKLADLDPLDPTHVHVQQLCKVRSGGREGIGILEHLVFGPHRPTGLSELLDGAR